jgi:VanZ family protein
MAVGKRVLREFSHPRLWLGIWVFGWLLCIVLSLMRLPDVDLEVPNGDKIEHVLAYAMLSAWSVLIFADRRTRWRAATALVALGIVLEFAQSFTGYRSMDAKDALADTLGVLIGQSLAWVPWRNALQRWDRRKRP